MKSKTFSGVSSHKESLGNGNNGGDTISELPKPVTRVFSTESTVSLTETEIEDVEGYSITRPGDEDKEAANAPSTETEYEEMYLEESGTEEFGEDNFAMDAFFSSYPELQSKSIAEVIIGTDNRVRISPTTSYPWRAICALRMTAKDNTKWIGTGWLVSPRTVITAGHCVYLHGHGGWPKKIEVIPAMNDASRPYGSFVGTTFRSVNGWINSKNRDYDYGAIILPSSSRPGDKTGTFGFAVKDNNYLKNSFLNLSGYPGDKGGAQQWFMAQKAKATSSRVIYYDIDSMGGQSGSPVWVKVGNTRHAVGIHTNGHITGNSATRIVTPVFNNIQAWKALGM